MTTFKHEVSFVSNELEGDRVVKRKVKKWAHFKELDETDKAQHSLHFKIFSLYRTGGTELNPSIKIDPEVLYEFTTESVKLLAVPDESFTTSDLSEFLASSRGLLKFGLWFLENHVVPFIKEYNS